MDRKMLLVSCVFIATMALGTLDGIRPVRAEVAHMSYVGKLQHNAYTLFCDGFTATETLWGEFGNSPYLRDIDTANYIATPTRSQLLKNESYFTFDDLGSGVYPDGLDNATLYFYAKVDSFENSFDVYGGINGARDRLGIIFVESSSYAGYSLNVSDCFSQSTQYSIHEDINSFRIALVYGGIGPVGPQESGMTLMTISTIYVTCAQFYIWVNRMDGDVWRPDTAAAGWGKLNHVNFDNDPVWSNRRYWTGFGIKAPGLINLAEVGLYCLYNEDNTIHQYRAFFTYIDNGGSAHTDSYPLDHGDMGKYFFFMVKETSPRVWQGGFQLQDGNWHWFDSHTYTYQWIGVWISSIESIHQPSSGQSGYTICAWYDIWTRDPNGNWSNGAIDYRVDEVGYYCHATYPVPDRQSNSWYSFVQYS